MISKDKQYRTRDGREVRIYATDGIPPASVHGAVKTMDGWLNIRWTNKGSISFHTEDNADLIEVKPRIKREYWVNVYPEHCDAVAWANKASADHRQATLDRIACVKVVIDCEEGEGL